MTPFYVTYRYFAYPALRTAFSALSLFVPKIKKGLEMRKGRPWLNAKLVSRPLWFHCASGEFEYAKPVITELKSRAPELPILVTYFSPTFAQAVEKFPGVDFATPLPWDTRESVQEFLNTNQPQALLVARTDTWPEMISEAQKFGLPTLLFAATLPANAGRVKSRLGRWMSRAVFSKLETIFCVSDDDLASFIQLGFGDRTRVAGDTRYDQVLARLKTPKPIKEDLFSDHSKDRTIVCGSTWSEDESILIEAATRLKKFSFVLVPHEPTDSHLSELEQKIATAGLKSVRYSTGVSWDRETILIVDQIGILAELYTKGAYAFVGGSFRKTVHSVMEPLAIGCVTLVGPKHLNNREAVEFKQIQFNQEPLVQVIDDASAMVERLERPRDLTALGSRVRREIETRAGKSAIVVDWVLKRIPTN